MTVFTVAPSAIAFDTQCEPVFIRIDVNNTAAIHVRCPAGSPQRQAATSGARVA